MFGKLIENKTNLSGYSLGNWLQTQISEEDLLKESTYNKCIKYNAESIAKCPLVLKQSGKDGDIEAIKHRFYNTLRCRANRVMTINDCLKTFIAIGEHEGISALYIQENELFPAKIRQILVDDAGILSKATSLIAYDLDICGQSVLVTDSECIVYRSGISWDNVRNNKAIKDYLKNTIKTTVQGQEYLSKLFDNGMCSKILVQLTSDIKEEKDLRKVQDKFNRLYSNDGRTFTVPAGFNISSLNMSLTDSQFKEIRSMSRVEIANAFGLTASMIGEDNGDIEKDTLRYMQDTLLFKLQTLEQEFDYKLLTAKEREQGYKIRFNTNVLLRTNAKTQQEIVCEYVKNGLYSLEYGREILGVPNKQDGTVLLPSGEILLKDLLNGKASWQKNSNNNDNAKGGDK